ncbi:hypothetical protein H6F89_34195 [Cyanobacteria bacterium FACHB-63]|nr:hypothetical protein [Cyanobacteria bacterium FACHB-63]
MNTLARISYPHFVPNQVLKDSDLNNLVDYLEQQTRFTRIHLIGMGIARGLEATSLYELTPQKRVAITISAGCGVTSEGYLVALANTVLTHYQPAVPVPQTLFNLGIASDPTPNSAASASVNSPTSSPKSNFRVIELFTSEGTNRISLDRTLNGADLDQAAFTAFLANRILVVAWAIQDTERDSCLIDCDNRGADRSFSARFFLLPQLKIQETPDDNLSAETLLRKGYAIDNLPDPWRSLSTQAVFESRYTFLQLKDADPNVLRFGYTQELVEGSTNKIPTIRLDKILNYPAFAQQYYSICQNAIDAISEAFPQIALLFSPFFSSIASLTEPFQKDFDGKRLRDRLQLQLDKIVPESRRPLPSSTPPVDETTAETTGVLFQIEAQYALQYFYDYLSQLVAAYRELVETAFDLMADCCPETQRFPRFLLLGQVSAPNAALDLCAPPSAYRSHFTQPPIYNDNGKRVSQVRHLYNRLVHLCDEDSFYLLPFSDTPLKITPSKDRSAPLSEQAIPYYLNYLKLYRDWSYDDCCKGRSARHPAYFYPAQSNPPFVANSELVFRHDEANFYRIEGHIGETKETAFDRIKDYQLRYNLPFDVITLKIGTITSLNDLNISGQFDDLEADFGRMRDRFQQLWDKYDEARSRDKAWSRNIFLQTLMSVFFDQTTLISFFDQKNLTQIRYSQLFNPVLALAADPNAYDFIRLPGTGYRYHLQLKTPGTHIARFVTEQGGEFRDLELDFTGLEDSANSTEGTRIQQEKTRIQEELSACLGLGRITYGLAPQTPNNQMSHYVQFSVEEELNLPLDPTTNRSRGTVPIRLITLNYFSVNIIDGKPSITQPEFQDFETLYGLLRDVPENYVTDLGINNFTMGDRQAADCLNFFEVKGLLESCKNRLEKLMKLHLFHEFACNYPGIEHLGGVPKGGTFILVYVDGRELIDQLLATESNPQYLARSTTIRNLVQFPIDSSRDRIISKPLTDRSDMVIADFCLPYRCCSTSPSVNYLMAQPRPIVLLQTTTFCEGDRKSYEFILDPEDGVLKGKGVVEENGKYYFRPSSIKDIPQDGAITFTYVVKGSYDTFTVTVHPLPEATLSVGDRDRFCANDDLVKITVTPTVGTVELVSLTIAEANIPVQNPVFDPSQYGKTAAQTVEIVAQIRDRSTPCTNTLRQTVTVYPLPTATFNLDPEREGDRYCAGQTVELQPSDPATSQGFTVNGEALPGNTLDLQNEGQEPIELTIEHKATSEGDCTAQSSRTITVFPLPNANFSLGTDSVCSNGEPVPLKPEQEGGTFRALDLDGNVIPDAFNEAQSTFNPKAVPMGEARSVNVRIEYEITGEGGCTSLSRQRISILNAPRGNFELALGARNVDRFTVQVSNIRPQDDNYEFSWEFPPGVPNVNIPTNRNFRINYNYQNVTTDRVEVRLTVSNGECVGETITKQVPVPPPVRDDSVLFDRRLEGYQQRFNQLGENARLRGTPIYRSAGEVLSLKADVPALDAINRYESFTKGLTTSYPRSGEGRKAELTQLMAVSTARLLDRLLTEDLAPTIQERLKAAIDGVREVGVDAAVIQSVWNPDAIRDVTDTNRLNQLEALVAG